MSYGAYAEFEKTVRRWIQEEISKLGEHKLVGVVDYISSSGNKYFADVFLNGYSPKFQDAFSSFGNWTSVAGSFSVSGGIATSSAAAQDLAIVTGSSYSDLTFICQVNIPAFSASQEVEVIIRYTNANNYYALVHNNGTLLLRRMQNGTATTLASVSAALSTNTWYWLRIQAQGSRLTGWLSTDGKSWTNQIQATDTNFASGAIGIRDTSLAAEYQLPTVYTGVTPVIPVRPSTGSVLQIGQEVFVERINFNGQDLMVDTPRVI